MKIQDCLRSKSARVSGWGDERPRTNPGQYCLIVRCVGGGQYPRPLGPATVIIPNVTVTINLLHQSQVDCQSESTSE